MQEPYSKPKVLSEAVLSRKDKDDRQTVSMKKDARKHEVSLLHQEDTFQAVKKDDLKKATSLTEQQVSPGLSPTEEDMRHKKKDDILSERKSVEFTPKPDHLKSLREGTQEYDGIPTEKRELVLTSRIEPKFEDLLEKQESLTSKQETEVTTKKATGEDVLLKRDVSVTPKEITITPKQEPKEEVMTKGKRHLPTPKKEEKVSLIKEKMAPFHKEDTHILTKTKQDDGRRTVTPTEGTMDFLNSSFRINSYNMSL